MRTHKRVVVFVFVLMLILVGCSKNQSDESEATKSDYLNVMNNTITKLDNNTLITQELSNEDAEIITKIINGGSWNINNTNEYKSDYAITLKGKLIYYDSQCGTFIDYDISDFSYLSAQESNVDNKTMDISNVETEKINVLLEKYK